MKAAVSRLPFGPKPKEMEVTDIASGHFVFSPVREEKVSYEALEKAITDAGYEIEDAKVVVSGTMTEERHVETAEGQVFLLAASADELKGRLEEIEPGAALRVRGDWLFRAGTDTIDVVEFLEPAAPEVDGGEDGH